MRVIIIGSTGQLGTDLMEALRGEFEVMGLTHREIEVTDYNSCLLLKERHPDVIINTAAFHKTDQCEEDPLRTFSVNAIGSRNVATVSHEMRATTIFISTDYVFDGSKNEPYSEVDIPNPINTYGISKLAGEFYTRQNERHYILRVASLFGEAGASGKGGNFVETMMAKAKKKEPIAVVDDMWMSPTYTRDAAGIIREMLGKALPYGIYHGSNAGYCTWYQFAKEIFTFTGIDASLTPVKTDQLGAKAKRPRFSALRSIELPKYGIQARGWESALRDYLIRKGHIGAS
jgi:dTDP-4-dehydrorhamnose reductase